jgi:hypothetical protein
VVLEVIEPVVPVVDDVVPVAADVVPVVELVPIEPVLVPVPEPRPLTHAASSATAITEVHFSAFVISNLPWIQSISSKRWREGAASKTQTAARVVGPTCC